MSVVVAASSVLSVLDSNKKNRALSPQTNMSEIFATMKEIILFFFFSQYLCLNEYLTLRFGNGYIK